MRCETMYKQERKEHPSFTRNQIERIVKDHLKKEGRKVKCHWAKGD